MPKIIIAIDPGKNGGIVILNGKNVIIKKMPDTPKDLADFLNKFAKLDAICVLEKVQGLPGMGGSAMFQFGMGYGWLTMALLLLEIKTYTVTPQMWQKSLQLGTTKSSGKMTTTQWKNVLKAKAQQLFPNVKVLLWSADALLLAEYGSKTYLNS